MPYVKRDSQQQIVAVSETPLEGFESVAEQDEALALFMARISHNRELSQTDLGFIRVVEDVIELLIAKNIILFTELPGPAQEKMLTRQRLRDAAKGSLDLLGDNEF